MKDSLVVKSNDVIEASYRLSLSEQRLILVCVQQIKKGLALSKWDAFEVSALDFAKTYGISQDRAYSELQNVAEKLYDRSVTVHNPDPDRPKLATTKTRWISSIDYIPSEGRIALTFAQKMIPYIAMLEGGFTRYNLENITDMRSVYGIRFYEFFKCWIFQENKKKISLEALKDKLELTGKYPSIKDFKLRVLDKAMKDINQYSDLTASYETIKTGRRITHIEFSFKYKKGREETQTQIPNLDTPISEIDNKLIARYVAENPELTTGWSTTQIIKKLKEIYPKAKVTAIY